MSGAAWSPLGRTELARRIRAAVVSHIVDACGSAGGHGFIFDGAAVVGGRPANAAIDADAGGVDGSGVALYTLADPRDLAAVRYVGQTRAPRRRFTQHLATARLWMPDELPWWIATPRLRPLYDWIRALHRDDYRLPVMVIADWVAKPSNARSAERALIERCLRDGAVLLNIEAERAGPQMPLL